MIVFGIEIWGYFDIHLNKIKLIMKRIIKFMLTLPKLTYNKEFNVLDFVKLLTKFTLLLVFKREKYLPAFYHNYNTRFKKKVSA